MILCLFEDTKVDHLKPLIWTRPVYDLRLGMRTLLETARDAFRPEGIILHTRPFLAEIAAQEYDFPVNELPEGADILFVNGRYIADEGDLLERLRHAASPGEPARIFVQNDDVIAAWAPGNVECRMSNVESFVRNIKGISEERIDGAAMISRLWHLLDALHPALHRDYEARVQAPSTDANVHESVIFVHPDQIYLAPTATVAPGAILNAEEGPIYVDEQATIQEHVVIKGPAYIGPRTQVKAAAHIEGCAFGYYVKVAGEVEDTVIHSLSNKAHPGFLGSSYLGRWCNLGADTNNSNLKNDYGRVTLYDAVEEDFISTGRQFAGLFMRDHSKCGINTMFNTGSVVGVSCNVFGAGFPPRHIPSFSWGGAEGFAEYRLEKALRVAEAVMKRRDVSLSAADRAILDHVFKTTR